MLTQLRQQFSTFWTKQSRAQRLVLVVLVATGFVLVPIFLVWAGTPTYAVAFNGLSETDAGGIVEKLDEANIPYQLRSSGTILVSSDRVYEVRLMMARQGLPENGSVGFELFNGNTLGMTEFTQRVNYQQAMEGELERTIGSLEAVGAVRVHIVTPERALLAADQAPTTASVTVKEKASMHLDAAQVRSITHLVASSVEGLKPENVVVVDVNGNLLASGESSGDGAMAAQTDERRAAEILAAKEIQNKVQKLLDSALGPNKSVVQAQVMMDWTARETTTQSYEPTESVLRSSQDVMETYTTTNGTLAGVPGATSNLPGATASLIPESQSVVYTRTESTKNYEITQVQAHAIESPGKIERVSLSVLVDGVSDPGELAKLQTVIGAAAGIDTTRGDTLAVETLAFDRSFYEAQAAELDSSQSQQLYMQIGVAVAAGLLLLTLLWYISRLLGNLRVASAEAWTPVLRPVSDLALAGAIASSQLPRTTSDSRSKAELEAMIANLERQQALTSSPQPRPAQSPAEAKSTPQYKPLPKMELPTISAEEEQLRQVIKGLSEEDPSSLASVIQLWLSEDERRSNQR